MTFLLALMAIAHAGQTCNVPGFPMVHRWLLANGDDALSDAPVAATGGAIYHADSFHPTNAYAVTKVERQPDGTRLGGALETTMPWIETWTWEGWIHASRVRAPTVIARFTSSAETLASVTAVRTMQQAAPPPTAPVGTPIDLTLTVDCAARELSLGRADARVEIPAKSPICGGNGWARIAVVFDRTTVRVELDADASPDAPVEEVHARALNLRVGVGSVADAPLSDNLEVDVDEMAFHAEALDPPASDERVRRWCAPAMRERLAYVEPFGKPTFELRGYYLGVVGQVLGTSEDSVARQRLVIGTEVQVSRLAEVVVQARTLETRGLGATGSLLTLPDEGAGTTEPDDFGLSIEQAFVARNSLAYSAAPLFFAVGRIPITFGGGIAEQNSMGAMDPSPWSPHAIFGDVITDPTAVRTDASSDHTFGSTLDGGELGLRLHDPVSGVASWIAVRAGRRNPWCAGRVIASPDEAGPEICPEEMASVYEYALVLSAESVHVFGSSGESVVGLSAAAGVRSVDIAVESLEPAKGHFVNASLLVVTPRPSAVWLRAAGDLALSSGIQQPNDAPPAPIEYRGSFLGWSGQVDLAARSAPAIMFSLGGGGCSAYQGRTESGLHPDSDVDLVGFEQVVAAATASAIDGSGVLPSLGGVVGGQYARLGVTLRLADIVEIPIAVLREWTTLSIPGWLRDGPIGNEFDVSARVRAVEWRFSASYGLLAPGSGVIADDVPTGTFAVRVARNL